MLFRLYPDLATLPRLHKLTLPSLSQDLDVSIATGLRVIHLDSVYYIDQLTKSAQRWPRSLRVLVVRLSLSLERPSEVDITQLKHACRARRVILRRERWPF